MAEKFNIGDTIGLAKLLDFESQGSNKPKRWKVRCLICGAELWTTTVREITRDGKCHHRGRPSDYIMYTAGHPCSDCDIKGRKDCCPNFRYCNEYMKWFRKEWREIRAAAKQLRKRK